MRRPKFCLGLSIGLMIIHVGLNKPIGYLGDLCLKSKEIQLLYMIVIIVIILIFARPPPRLAPGARAIADH